MKPSPDLLSIPRAAKKIGIGYRQMRELVAKGNFQLYSPLGTKRMIKTKDIETFIDNSALRQIGGKK